jgi:hypothetical protein
MINPLQSEKFSNLSIYFNSRIPKDAPTPALSVWHYDLYATDDLNALVAKLYRDNAEFQIVPLAYGTIVAQYQGFKSAPVQALTLQAFLSFWIVRLTLPGATVTYYNCPNSLLQPYRDYQYEAMSLVA